MVKENFHIRRAVPGDAALLSTLSAVTFYDTFNGTCTNDDINEFIEATFSERQVYNELMNADDFYFIAFINDKAAGYLRLKEEESDVPEIRKHRAIELKRIYVLKEFHSQKIGAELMAFALDFAAEQKYDLIWLGVWEHNERAKSFYKKFGFIDTGHKHPFPIGKTPQTDHWFLRSITKK